MKNLNFILFSFAFLISGCSSLQSNYSGHGTESVDPLVLKKYAPPSLPDDVSSFVQNILEVNAPGMGILTPDGKTMFFGWGITGVSQIWKLDRPLGFPVQLTSGKDSTSVVDISPDGRWLIISRDRSGEENPGFYLQPSDGGPLLEIQHKPKVQTFYVWITNDSETLYYMANDREPSSYALYSYHLPTRKKELLFSEPGLWFVSDVKGDDRFLLGKRTGARSREFYYWSKKERVLKPLIGQGESEDYSMLFAKADGEYLVKTPKFGEFQRLYVYRDKKFVPITPEVAMDVEGVSIDYARMRIYLHWNDNGRSRLEIRNAANFEIVKIPEFKNADHIYAGRTSRFGRYVTLGVESSVEPRTSYVFDWKENKLAQWVRPSIPEIDTTRFRTPQLEHFIARDGTRIPMWVTRPDQCAAKPCPVIVHFHGGPESQSRPEFNRLAQIFSSAGFIFVDPNVRGSRGYGKNWAKADDGIKRLQVITDIEDCALYIRKNWAEEKGSPPRIGVMGWSYGGYATLLAMSKFAGAYDAGVSFVGMSDLRSFLKNTAPYRRSLRVTEYGDPDTDRDTLEKLSPIQYIDKVKDPLMIIQGVSDPRVPAGEAIQMYQKLKAKGVTSSLILFADEGHGATSRTNRILELGNAFLFLRENLLKE